MFEQNSSQIKTASTFKESKTKKNLNNNLVSSIKSNLIQKMAYDMENRNNIKKEKSSKEINKNINLIQKEKKTQIDIKEDGKDLDKNINIKNNIKRIKTQKVQFIDKKDKEKVSNKDKDIIIKNEEIKNEIKENKILKETKKDDNLNKKFKGNEEFDSEKEEKEDELDKTSENKKIENEIDNNIEEKQNIDNNEDVINDQNIINNGNELKDENNILSEKEGHNESFEEQIHENNLNEIKEENNYDENINIDNIIYNKTKLDSKNISINNNPKLEKRNLSDLDIDDFKDFKEEYYLNRKYDKTNVDKGKIFFKYRYLRNKYTQINETIHRLTTTNYHQPSSKRDNEKGRFTTFNASKENKKLIDQRYSHVNPSNSRFTLLNNVYLSNFVQNPSSHILNSIDKDSQLRHYHSQFLKITENSILYFNLKQFEESYLYLYMNGIIKNLKEFGEFLLVGNGYDKFIIGDFLAKNEVPNDKKEVLEGFVNGIKMKYEEISFLECIRFFMKRFYLPKDANLILEIMNTFCQIYFETNKTNEEFLNIFKNSNSIYLLISTLLAVNTMFTRKDIKNMNMIKKEEFISMNNSIQEAFLINLYDQLKIHPLEIESDNYNETVYRRMSTLIKEKFPKHSKSRKSFNLYDNDSNDENENEIINDFIVIENDNKENEIDSFNLTKNLYNFNDKDGEILVKIQKFHKFVGNELKHEREFLVHENYTKLIWGKNVEINKDKGNLHTIMIKDIKDVFNGVEHSEILKKYITLNPKEIKEKNHFITIITQEREINLKSDSLNVALLWYKALKSLVIKVKNENNKKKSENIKKMNKKFKLKLEALWKEFILPNWNIYGYYILEQLQKRKEIRETKNNTNNNKTTIAIINEVADNKILEYYDFFKFYKIGLPQFCRGTIWRFLIGNPCSMTEKLYENYLSKIEKVDFNDFDIRYHEDNNSIFNFEYNINQMIVDIIIEKDLLKDELLKLKIDSIQIMNKSYNILRVFYLIRNDLIYKKSIIPLIYIFLIVESEEYNAFCDIYNLICNNDIFKFYIDDEIDINKSLDFFNNLVEKHLPQIHKHFKNLEITHDLYFIPWMTELFSSSLELKLIFRIIDLYLIEGEYILYQTGLTILAIQEDDLLDLTIGEILNLVQRLPNKHKIKHFLKKMKNFDMTKNEYAKWKKENELGTQKLLLFQAIFNDDN